MDEGNRLGGNPLGGLTQDQQLAALVTVAQIGNVLLGNVSQTLKTQFPCQGSNKTFLAVANSSTGGTLISASASYLIGVSVTTASTGATGTLYDANAVVNATSSAAFAIIPSSGFVTYNWPLSNGLVVQPSSSGGHTVSVSYIA